MPGWWKQECPACGVVIDQDAAIQDNIRRNPIRWPGNAVRDVFACQNCGRLLRRAAWPAVFFAIPFSIAWCFGLAFVVLNMRNPAMDGADWQPILFAVITFVVIGGVTSLIVSGFAKHIDCGPQ